MINSVFKSLSAGLTLWKNKDARKYLDKVIKLKKEYYAEDGKENPNDEYLGNIEFELSIISEAFHSKVSSQATESQS